MRETIRRATTLALSRNPACLLSSGFVHTRHTMLSGKQLIGIFCAAPQRAPRVIPFAVVLENS
jgi:hypothetical protein